MADDDDIVETFQDPIVGKAIVLFNKLQFELTCDVNRITEDFNNEHGTAFKVEVYDQYFVKIFHKDQEVFRSLPLA